MKRPRVVFFGTPAFAVPSLVSLASFAEVVAVVSQPDRPAGRGNVISHTPVKIAALERGIEVRQPEKLRDGVVAGWLRELRPDVAIVVAYGRILPPDILTAPVHGCVNVHASILPKHRGAAPIQWSVIHGDHETGVTLMQMDEGLDTGPMLAVMRTPIGPDETSLELSSRLSHLGADIVRSSLPDFLLETIKPVTQDHASHTLAPLLTRELGRIDWNQTAQQIHDRVRGLQPWPGCSTTLSARRMIVGATRLDDPPTILGGAPGEVVAVTRDRIWVATRQGVVGITEVQLEGKKRVTVKEFLAGHPVRTGTMLGQEIVS
jgi:methionyl-tRNA formyltransferase